MRNDDNYDAAVDDDDDADDDDDDDFQLLDPEEDPSQFSVQISEMAHVSALNALRFAQVVLMVIEGSPTTTLTPW